MQEEFDEVLIRITFHSSKVHKLMLDIPYNAKEKLSVKLDQEQVLFLPFNELVQVFSQSESALINLAPLVQYIEYPHKLRVQTYSLHNLDQKKSIFDFSIDFANLKLTAANNTIDVFLQNATIFKSVKVLGVMSPYLKIIQHGATWVGTVVTNGNCNPVFNEQALIRFKMLKEKIKFELWHEEEKIGETTMYAFEMLGERQTKSVEMTRNQTVVATLSFVCQSCLPHILSELS